MPIFTAVLVVVFGGLTLYLQDDVFIKMKPTVLYAFFGALLLGGLSFNRLFIKYVFAQAFELDEPGWKKLTIRWGIFFLALAAINEAVWRATSTETWVAFKVWGIIPLLFLFALAPLRRDGRWDVRAFVDREAIVVGPFVGLTAAASVLAYLGPLSLLPEVAEPRRTELIVKLYASLAALLAATVVTALALGRRLLGRTRGSFAGEARRRGGR